jgi:uncharacterized spore protein YtfJ
MNANEMLQNIGGTLGSTATVKSVFGEPIHAEGKTVVPIAKVAYGFGAGGGSRHAHAGDSAPDAGSGGGGGGVRVCPAGVLEITATRTRFIPFVDLRLLAAVFAGGVLLGKLLLGRRHKS